MFNTISKQCLLCLRLVSCGGSLLQSGFVRDGVDCVPLSCFCCWKHYESVCVCVGGGVSVLFCILKKMCVCMCAYSVWAAPAPPEITEEMPPPRSPHRTSQEDAFST